MMNPALRPDASLPEFLAARARAASDGRLVFDVAAGSIAAIAVVIWRPAIWLSLAAAAMCLTTFGLWGIADRVVRERASTASARWTRVAVVVRLVVASVGVLAAITTFFAALGPVLGTWIS
jgi:hypothetical protein